MDPLKTETVHLVPQDGGQIPSAGIVIIFLRISLVGVILKISFKQKGGGAKSGFLDKGVPVTQSPMDQMT